MNAKKAIAVGLALLAFAAVATPTLVTVFVPVIMLVVHTTSDAVSSVAPNGPPLGCKPFCPE